jgi:hypothetical protein
MAMSAIDDIHVADEGTIIRVELKDGGEVLDVSTASIKKIKFKKPNGTVVSKNAAFTTDGSDGKIQYTTEASPNNILDEPGKWEYQAYIEMSGKWHSEKLTFIVRDNVE